MNKNVTLPKLKTDKLVVKELPNEILLYDLETHKAFCLNETARVILDQCDGKTTIGEAINVLNGGAHTELTGDLIWTTIGQFQELVSNDFDALEKTANISRRKVLRAAAALGISLPIVSSLVAPMAVHAQSCCAGICNCLVDPMPCCPGTVCVPIEPGFGQCLPAQLAMK